MTAMPVEDACFSDTLGNLSKNCKRRRRAQGSSVARLEQVSGVKAATIWRIEGGVGANPTLRTLCKLADALDCPLSDLLEP